MPRLSNRTERGRTVGRCHWVDDLDALGAIERNLTPTQLAAVQELASLMGYDCDDWLRCPLLLCFRVSAARRALDARLEEITDRCRAEREVAWELRVPESTVRGWLRLARQ